MPESLMPVTRVCVGDRVRLDGKVYTVAVSEPCDLNAGAWHLEMEEDDPNAPSGWPYSIRYLNPDATIERIKAVTG